MTIEARTLLRELASTPPLDKLPQSELTRWQAATEILYFRAGEPILQRGRHNAHVWLIRTGSVEVLDESGQLVNLLAEGDWFGYRSVLNDGEITLDVITREDALVWRFPAELFLEHYRKYDFFRTFFHQHKPARFRHALASPATDGSLPDLGRPLSAMASVLPVRSTHASLQAVAHAISEAATTTLLIRTSTDLPYRLLTQADLVQAMAKGHAPHTPVAQAFDKAPPLLLPAHLSTGEALTRLLNRHETKAVVALGGDRFGLFDLADLRDRPHPLFDLLESISAASTPTALKTAAEKLPELFLSLVRSHTPPRLCGELISRAGEALVTRTLQLLQHTLELPQDVPFSLVALGSLARHEQTLRTDQDNALILGDHFDALLHGPAFEQLALRFNDILAELGYAYCPHEVMARNPRWRLPLHQWLKDFRHWIEEPTPDALLNAAIFFDMRLIGGDEALLAHLRDQVLRWSRDSGLFLHHMAANALRFRPPIGFFRTFIVEDHGDRAHVFDIKKHGIAPITELARVHALTGGLKALNTWERLEQAAEAGLMSQQGHADLRDALDLIALVRLQHQARQVERGETPDNLIDPDDLSRLERRHLRDAFTIVREMQQALALHHNL
ncbi:putative nucleotidyltransferase substrate binding domain-containing protein [Sulfurivirga sp.]|uniref:putative nucleotidyltransferase substrate binding domain-containing protein n=1 Tax=Sulfurivirga sp. TaxID=2614236 RepID=UPI0025D136E0|nr:putative nucleotidyltransferase substrate binding domain-containing protein [Sulfurivirga sp.]